MTIELFTNTGSLIAVILFFKTDIKELLNETLNFSKKSEKTTLFFLILSTLPAGLIGFFFTDTIAHYFKSTETVAFALILTSFLLFFIRHFNGNKTLNDMTASLALLVGIAQSIALIPGISRSGATIVALLLLQFNRKDAFTYSFLMSIPISIAGLLYLAIHVESRGELLLYLGSTFISFISTYVALILFKKIMENGKLIYFSFYCVSLALFLLFFL